MNATETMSRIESVLKSFSPNSPEDLRQVGLWLADRCRQLCGDANFKRAGETITIYRRIPSQNDTTYRHWRLYVQEKKQWKIQLRAALKPRLKAPDHLVYLQITSYRNRLLDFANLVGGAKPIPDCLQEMRYLRDDSPEWVKIDYYQQKVPRAEERTEIVFFAPA